MTLRRAESQLHHLQLPTQGKGLTSHYSSIRDAAFKLQIDVEDDVLYLPSVPFDGDCAPKGTGEGRHMIADTDFLRGGIRFHSTHLQGTVWDLA